MNKVDELHQLARDIMERLNEKYNITNEYSLDEYLDEFRGMLIEDEIIEILECLNDFSVKNTLCHDYTCKYHLSC